MLVRCYEVDRFEELWKMKTGYLETGKSRQCSTHADHKSGRRDERLRVSSYVDGRLWLGALVPGNKQEDRSRVLVPRTH